MRRCDHRAGGGAPSAVKDLIWRTALRPACALPKTSDRGRAQALAAKLKSLGAIEVREQLTLSPRDIVEVVRSSSSCVTAAARSTISTTR